MMKKPVAKFPIGKYIGKMRAGIVKIAAAWIHTGKARVHISQ